MRIFKNRDFKKIKKLTIILMFFSFIMGFLYRHNKPAHLVFLKNIFYENLHQLILSKFTKNTSNKSCPNKIYYLPKNAILIIGHAYGSHAKSESRGNIGIAPKVNKFYLKNQQNIDAIIFSGDVLKEPSIKKWNDFYSEFNKDTKIFIAPGNHDVGGIYFDSALRDVFNYSTNKNQMGREFPFKVIINQSLFIIGDSNSKETSIDKILSIIEQEKVFKNIFVVIHHAFPEGLKNAVNGRGKHNFINDSFFKEKFKDESEKKIFFLYGDGGAFKYRPRFKCIKLGSTFHMINGIGELEGDTIFVIKDNNIYLMEI